MADVTYSQGVMAERAVNDPAPVGGEPLGAGLVAMRVVPYVLDVATDAPVKLKSTDFLSDGGGGTTVVITVAPSREATREKYLAN